MVRRRRVQNPVLVPNAEHLAVGVARLVSVGARRRRASGLENVRLDDRHLSLRVRVEPRVDRRSRVRGRVDARRLDARLDGRRAGDLLVGRARAEGRRRRQSCGRGLGRVRSTRERVGGRARRARRAEERGAQQRHGGVAQLRRGFRRVHSMSNVEIACRRRQSGERRRRGDRAVPRSGPEEARQVPCTDGAQSERLRGGALQRQCP